MSKRLIYGLIGKNISYSFSKNYFTTKFDNLGLSNCSYVNFDIQNIEEFSALIKKNRNQIKGFNVTIPYKEKIIKYLDEIEEKALEIGAINTIKILNNNRLKGFNTDIYGFKHSLIPLLNKKVNNALILGTGGASKAVAFVLKNIGISFKYVSRNPIGNESISYEDLDENILLDSLLIINCTPLGTFPKVQLLPAINYQYLTKEHILYDLVYNPSITCFMQKGLDVGATVKNGEEMLQLQADKSWKIWNS